MKEATIILKIGSEQHVIATGVLAPELIEDFNDLYKEDSYREITKIMLKSLFEKSKS